MKRLTLYEYAEKLVILIIKEGNESKNGKMYIKAPLPDWANMYKDLRDKVLKYVNFPHPRRTGHRWYLRKDWDDVLSKILRTESKWFKTLLESL